MVAHSQSQIIKVLDSSEHTPIEFAYININDSLNFITNSDGIVSLGDIVSKELAVRIQMLGYNSKIITIDENVKDTLYIRLAAVPIRLEAVTISSQKQKTLSANEIVSIAIDSLNSKILSNNSISGFYSQIHYSIPQTGINEEGKLKLAPVLDTVKNFHFLLQASVHLEKVDSDVEIDKLRRSDDSRNYQHASSSGKGRSFAMNYVSTKSESERIEAIEREKRLYNLNGFFKIDPILNHANIVSEKKNETLFLASGTYGYLNTDFIKRHSLKLVGVVNYENEKVAKIKILPKSNSYQHGIFGKHHWIPIGFIYIRLSDFGILRMEYSYILNPRKKNFSAWATNALIGIPILFKDVILYKEIDGELKLAYLSRFQSDIDVDKSEQTSGINYHFVEREFFSSQYNINNEMSSGIQTLYDPYQYDEKFWRNTSVKYKSQKEFKQLINDLEKVGGNLNLQFIKSGEN